jgi:CBS domain-containing protein
MLESPMPPPPRRTAATTVAEAMISVPLVSDTATSARDVAALFDDDHIHSALIVDGNGVLVAVVERADLWPVHGHDCPAATLGALQGRVVAPTTSLARAQQILTSSGRRRLAVVDIDGRLLGLLCLKRSRTGFCSDHDVRARQRESEVCHSQVPRKQSR